MRWMVVAVMMLAGACATRSAPPPDPQEMPRAWTEIATFDDFSRECAIRAGDRLRTTAQLEPTETRVLRPGKRFQRHYRAARIVEFYTTTGAAPETWRFSCRMSGPGTFLITAL